MTGVSSFRAGCLDFVRPWKSISRYLVLVWNTCLSAACLCGLVWYIWPVSMASLVTSVRYLSYRDEWQSFLTGRVDALIIGLSLVFDLF